MGRVWRSVIRTLLLLRFDGSDRTCHGQSDRSGRCRPFSGHGILREGRGGDGEHAVAGLEYTGRLVIGVVCTRYEGDAVQSRADTGQYGAEGIGYRGILSVQDRGVAAVHDLEGVGQLTVFRSGDRGDRLDDRELCSVGDRYGFLCGDRADRSAVYGNGVRDRTACFKRRIAVDRRRVDDRCVAVRGDRDIAEHQTVCCRRRRVGLQDAVLIVLQRACNIVQRLYRPCAECVCAEIVADRQPVDRLIGIVDDADDIGQRIARAVLLVDGVFGDAEHTFDQTDGDIGQDLFAVVAQCRYIRK